MDLEKLSLFIAAAEHGGFEPAAKKLYTSRSTVSRAVASLEKELGTELIRRSANHSLGLTPAGDLLLEEGRSLLAQLDALSQKIREMP